MPLASAVGSVSTWATLDTVPIVWTRSSRETATLAGNAAEEPPKRKDHVTRNRKFAGRSESPASRRETSINSADLTNLFCEFSIVTYRSSYFFRLRLGCHANRGIRRANLEGAVFKFDVSNLAVRTQGSHVLAVETEDERARHFRFEESRPW